MMVNIRYALLGVAAAALFSGCAWVKIKPQGEKVRVLSAEEVKHCKSLGRVSSNTAASVWFIARSRETVEEEVSLLARNNAGDMGGDTIVPAGPLVDGEQKFTVYRCINP